jgi:hypothetical protein
MNLGIITNPSAAQVQVVQSAEAEDLQSLVNAALLATAGIVTSITLAGGGDGHTFVVQIESAPAPDVIGGVPTLSGATQVRCYLAGTGSDLALAKASAGVPAPIPPDPPDPAIPFVLAGEEVAGSSKGTRLMGMSVFLASAIADSFNKPIAAVNVSGALAPGANILTLAALAGVGFSLPAPQVLRYDRGINIEALLDASVTVQLDAAGAFTVEIVRDPLGTPVVIATVPGSVDVAGGSENVSLTWFATLTTTALSAILDRVGIRVTAPGAGTVTGGNFRVAAR